MNDFSELEAELKQLRPAAPSSDLARRIERHLTEQPATTKTAGMLARRDFRVNWFALGLGVAAAAAFLMLARVHVDQPKPKERAVASRAPAAAPRTATARPRTLLPDGVTRVLYDTSDEGLVFARNSDQPVRRVRSRSRETLQWKDSGTGASLRVSYPTEEIELIPVSGQ